jgi:hypothetical protein
LVIITGIVTNLFNTERAFCRYIISRKEGKANHNTKQCIQLKNVW